MATDKIECQYCSSEIPADSNKCPVCGLVPKAEEGKESIEIKNGEAKDVYDTLSKVDELLDILSTGESEESAEERPITSVTEPIKEPEPVPAEKESPILKPEEVFEETIKSDISKASEPVQETDIEEHPSVETEEQILSVMEKEVSDESVKAEKEVSELEELHEIIREEVKAEAETQAVELRPKEMDEWAKEELKEIGIDEYVGEEALCPVCESIISSFSTKCDKCGAEFADESICATCGAVVPPESIFCEKCGSSFVEEDTVCPRCESVVPASSKNCITCGAEFVINEYRCSSCGTNIEVNDIICIKCGALLKEGVKKKSEIITLPEGAPIIAAAGAPQKIEVKAELTQPQETVVKVEKIELTPTVRKPEKKEIVGIEGYDEKKTKTERINYPFSAIVDQGGMKLALILNVIDPDIGGVLIEGQKGTAKSIAVRGIAELLPPITVIEGCRFSCDPALPDKLCWECREKYIGQDKSLPTKERPIKVVDLPLNATEDRVVGTIDVEKILTEGLKAFEHGILGEANRGILYIDEINLLDDYIVDVLLDAAALGVVTVERESVSVSYPAKFIIVGTMNPEEGALRPQLLDRIALVVKVKGTEQIRDRIEIIRRRDEFNRDPLAFRAKYQPMQELIKEKIIKARRLLPDVSISPEFLEAIAKISLAFGVDGHRADIIMERTAKALAAFEGHIKVEVSDIIRAAELALPHRMRKRPFEEEEFSIEKLRKVIEEVL